MKKLTVLAMLAMAAVFAGCCTLYKDHVTGPGADEIEVVSANTRVTPEGRMSAQVTLYNDDNDPVQFYYTITWYGPGGMVVSNNNPAAGRQDLTMRPFETRDIVHVAPQDDCTDFRIYISEPKD